MFNEETAFARLPEILLRLQGHETTPASFHKPGFPAEGIPKAAPLGQTVLPLRIH